MISQRERDTEKEREGDQRKRDTHRRSAVKYIAAMKVAMQDSLISWECFGTREPALDCAT